MIYPDASIINGITLIKNSVSKGHRRAIFKCPFCPNEFESRVEHIISGGTKSCGCRIKGMKARHGHTSQDGYRSPEYKSWSSMKARCNDETGDHYKYYKAQGIVICEGWLDFNNFFADLGAKPSPEHSIDRIKGILNYSCGKCSECLKNGWEMNGRWATRKEQQRNISNNLIVTYQNERKTLMQWCEEMKLPYGRMRERIFKLGMSAEIAFTLPKNDRSLYRKWKKTPEQIARTPKEYKYFVEYEGFKQPLKPICEKLGLRYSRMKYRIFTMKMGVTEALSEKGKLPNLIKDRAKYKVSNFISHSFGVVNTA